MWNIIKVYITELNTACFTPTLLAQLRIGDYLLDELHPHEQGIGDNVIKELSIGS